MNIHWRDVARHFLQIAAFCSAIAVLTTLIWPAKSYVNQFGYAMSIGTVSWLVVEFGRYLVDPRNCHASSSGGHGWPKGWRGIVLAGVGISCGFLLGQRIGDTFFFDTVGRVTSPRDTIISIVITAMAGTVVTFYFHSRGKAAVLLAQVNAAERDASEARLKLLESQLEPHMLFNTLANLRVLITTDPQRAVAMLDRLNSYLRATLSGSRTLAHPLAAEFDLLRDYLELMSVRMGERLLYTLDLPDNLRQVPVPPLLLQPLVENAIQHGLEPKVGGGSITVRASQRGSLLVIEVDDSGVGLSPRTDALAAPGRGFGLTHVRERLTSAFGRLGALELKSNPAGGTCVAATLPMNDVAVGPIA